MKSHFLTSHVSCNIFVLGVLLSNSGTAWTAEPAQGSPSAFRFVDVDDKTVKLLDGDSPVYAYNHGQITDEATPECDHRRKCGCFVHPVWGLDGEVLTDAFPADHRHHNGIFWRWRHVEIDGRQYDHWTYNNIRTRFIRWNQKETSGRCATLAVENGWFIDDRQGGERKVMVELVRLRAYPEADDSRSLDVELTFTPVDRAIALSGAGGKSYGGLTMRMLAWPATDATVRVPGKTIVDEGRKSLPAKGDLANTRLPWADLTRTFGGMDRPSGAAVFIHPSHPDYPPTWLTRCYGPLCVGYPGLKPETFEPGQPFALKYRVWIHRGAADEARIAAAYREYAGVGAEAAK